ncbi:unnamed protein product [Candidula unifasciata]|uniref:Uncharacterized protein n=1 Tax=Candidula unifasciata TaxID=100452 RepID=A0A8S3Z2Q3_9EUPU|nr:unnamed protein product [Candidula unifasciata]
MSSVGSCVQTYFLSITFLPQGCGLNLCQLLHGVKHTFDNFAGSTKILHKFKVIGEPRVIAVLDVSDVNVFENLGDSFCGLGPLDIKCFPMMHYELFAENLGVADELVKLPVPELKKDNLYWLDFDVEYPGKSKDELIEMWKKEAEFALRPRANKEVIVAPVLYKCIAQRKVHAFVNQPSLKELDKVGFEVPIMIDNGDNIQIRTKSLQMLEDYIDAHPLL